MFNRLASTLRELAAMYWRQGDHLQASALHMRAILLEAGCVEPADPHEAIAERMRELQAGRGS